MTSTASQTAASRLASLEALAEAGQAVDPAEFASAVAAAAAEARIIQLAETGRRRQAEDQSARSARKAQSDAKAAVTERLSAAAPKLLRAYTAAVEALRELADESDDYATGFAGSVRELGRGRVPAAVIPEPEPGHNDPVDQAHHAVYAPGRYDRAEIVVTDGVTHLLPADPAVWLLAALHEAAALPEGRSMSLPGGGSVHNLIGRRERPYLP